VREMLIQHVLTEEIFAKVFPDTPFHKDNNVARELYKLEATFFTGNTKFQSLKALAPYYSAISAAAARSSATTRSRRFSRSSTKTSTRSTTRKLPTGWAWCIRLTRSCAS
jgi:predicted helicase